MRFTHTTDRRRRTRRLNATVLIGALIVLYATTAAFWVVTLWATMTNYTILFVSPVQRIQSSLKNTVECLERAPLDHPDLDYISLISTCVHLPSASASHDYDVDDRFAMHMCVGFAATTITASDY